MKNWIKSWVLFTLGTLFVTFLLYGLSHCWHETARVINEAEIPVNK